jgi:membrane-associated phospholipid phosphatase
VRRISFLLYLALVASPAVAQEATPFQWTQHQAVPARISDAAVGIALGLDVWHSVTAADHSQRWRVACRTGLAVGVSELAKHLIHRTRPDGSDRMSFFSEHTALASSAASTPLGFSLAVTVGWGRASAGKHYDSDVAFGAAVGLGARWVCDR